MASNFFLVHHTFKPGMAEKWWANMKNYDEAKQKTHQENQAKAGSLIPHIRHTSRAGRYRRASLYSTIYLSTKSGQSLPTVFAGDQDPLLSGIIAAHNTIQ